MDTKSELQVSDVKIPNLPGIDVSDVLRRTDIKWGVFRNLLSDFCREQKMFLDNLREAVKENDPNMVRYQAHSIAGAAGNYGMRKLRTAAKEMESASASGWSKLLEAVEREFLIVQTSVGSLVGDDDPSERLAKQIPFAPDLKSGSEAKMELFVKSLRKLEQSLEKFDPVNSSSDMASVIALAGSAKFISGIDKDLRNLDRLIHDFRYKEADELLSRIIGKIQETRGGCDKIFTEASGVCRQNEFTAKEG